MREYQPLAYNTLYYHSQDAKGRGILRYPSHYQYPVPVQPFPVRYFSLFQQEKALPFFGFDMFFQRLVLSGRVYM